MSENFIQGGKASQQGNKPMSTAVATEYLRKMVERETAGNGDVENAVKRLARKYGLSFWQIMHLRAGRAKSITVDAYVAIRRAYLDYCEAEIRALQLEIKRDQERHGTNADLENLEGEIQALAARVRAAKGRSDA